MTRTDYYKTLGVEPSAPDAQLKSAYRQLAMRYHPDRNQGDSAAEERFKAINEAYAVLSDPQKRAAYDRARLTGFSNDFQYTPQEIFADLLRRMAGGGFREFGSEFSGEGLRFDEAFFRQVFFRNGPFVVRGFFYSRGGSPGGPMAGGWHEAAAPRRSIVGGWVLRQVGKAVLGLVGLGLRRLERRAREQASLAADLDLSYSIAVSREEARTGTTVDLSYPRGGRMQRVAVKVPPGTSHGTHLKLRQMGVARAGRVGDLLILVNVTA
ncbi:MAG: DnaJ domain-containing protein [Pseudomonadota bacterium]